MFHLFFRGIRAIIGSVQWKRCTGGCLTVAYWAVLAVFLITALWLILINPGTPRRKRMEAFYPWYIAHRGLHDNSGPSPENTLSAFALAAERGFGIELDVRETADEELVISHDASLKRMTGFDLTVEKTRWRGLRDLMLLHSEEHIPTFHEALQLIGGKVPVIVEIKADDMKSAERIAAHAADELDSYEGLYCVESFNPKCLIWFRKNRPETLRGQLSEQFRSLPWPRKLIGFPLSCCMFNFLTRPDFIAYDVHHAHLLRFQVFRQLFHMPAVSWTVNSPEALAEARKDFDCFIFEGFLPGKDASERTRDTEKERDMTKLIRKYMLVSGRVQGVGFRYRAAWIAQSLGVTGYVRNCMDERVEMELQGTPEQLELMMQQLRAQRYIEIDQVEEKRIDPVEHEYEFKVRH